MRQTIRKWFWAWDFEKEEKWLNELSAKGLALVAVGFCKYTFEEGVPGEYNVRLELLEHAPTHAQSRQYIQFVEETGAEYLGAVLRWVYFRKKTAQGEFSLYSDNASRIRHLNRLLALIGIVSLPNLCFGISHLFSRIGVGFGAYFTTGFLNLAFGLLGSYGFLRISRRKRALKKEQSVFE